MADRKDYKTIVSTDFVNRLLEVAVKNECVVECYEGVLLDNYVIHNTENIKIGRIKPRKDIILKERYLNEWSSATEMIMTGDIKTVDEFIRQFD